MKYIVDIPSELVLKDDGYSFNDGNSYCITGNLSKLTPYIEPDRKAIEDEVWDFIKEIECLTRGEAEDCFDVEYDGIPFVANMFSYQEAKAKYDAWKKEKEEIRVGDEVKHRGLNYVVGYVGADQVYHLIDKNWLRTVVQGGYQLIKTGRHFPEVAELLEKMRSKYV